MDPRIIIFLIVASVFAVCVLLYVVASIIRELCRRREERRERKAAAKYAKTVVVEEKTEDSSTVVLPEAQQEQQQQATYEIGNMMPTYQILPPPVQFVRFFPVEPKEPLKESNYDASNPKHRRALALWTCLVYATVGLAAICATALDRKGRSKSIWRKLYDWTR